jgi:hypothetical protein
MGTPILDPFCSLGLSTFHGWWEVRWQKRCWGVGASYCGGLLVGHEDKTVAVRSWRTGRRGISGGKKEMRKSVGAWRRRGRISVLIQPRTSPFKLVEGLVFEKEQVGLGDCRRREKDEW